MGHMGRLSVEVSIIITQIGSYKNLYFVVIYLSVLNGRVNVRNGLLQSMYLKVKV